MRRLLIPFFLVAGCSGGVPGGIGFEIAEPPRGSALTKVDPAKRPSFRIDADQPWKIDLGRGSGLRGLDTIRLDQDGRLEMGRLTYTQQGNVVRLGREQTSAQLPDEAVKKVLDAVEENHLLRLEAGYHADVCDGTQWVLWIRQGSRERATYFNNHFPGQVVRFARRLDEIIEETVGPKLRWERMLPWNNREHEKELWNSTDR